MASTKTLATAFAVTVALALSGLQSSVAQPGARFQNQDVREVPPPDQSLLKPQPPPDCAFKEPLSNPPTPEETRMKLDYEEQCYRQSEMIVRTRLEQLQKSIEKATKPTSRQPIVKPTSRQPVVETTTPTSRREPKGERHTFVRDPSSGNHRTSDTLSFGLPPILVIQLWVDPTTAPGILAVATRMCSAKISMRTPLGADGSSILPGSRLGSGRGERARRSTAQGNASGGGPKSALAPPVAILVASLGGAVKPLVRAQESV